LREISPHSPGCSGKGCRRSSKASRRENLAVEEPVTCRDGAACDFHAILARMRGPTWIRDQVIHVGEPCEKRLLAAPGMVAALPHEELPLDGVMGSIQQGAGGWHTRVFQHRIPAGFLVLEPAPDACPVDRPSRARDVARQVAEPLAQRQHAPTGALACVVEPRMALGA
jgi:hypothetical protein